MHGLQGRKQRFLYPWPPRPRDGSNNVSLQDPLLNITAFHRSSHLIFKTTQEVGPVIIPIRQMRKLRLRDVK